MNIFKNALRKIKEDAVRFNNDESGMQTIEVVLLIVLVIGLIFVFKNTIYQTTVSGIDRANDTVSDTLDDLLGPG